MIPTLNPSTIGGMPPLRDYVALAAKNGFRGVEFSIDDALLLSREISWDGVRTVFIENNVAPAAFEAPVEWREDDAVFRRDMEDLAARACAARELACTRAMTTLPAAVDDDRHEFRLQAVRRLHHMACVLGAHGIRLGLEWVGTPSRHHGEWADGLHPFIWNMGQALDLIDDICAPDENVGLVVDSFHWHANSGTMDNLLSLTPDQIVHVHVCDAPKKPVSELADDERMLPGEGQMNLWSFLEGLQHNHYQAFVAVESCCEDRTDFDRDRVAARAGASLNAMLDNFHRRDDGLAGSWELAHAKHPKEEKMTVRSG